jgi:hypothetical protein
MRSGRNENEHGISLPRFVHARPVKFPLRRNQRIDIQLTALNKNADLAGSF